MTRTVFRNCLKISSKAFCHLLARNVSRLTLGFQYMRDLRIAAFLSFIGFSLGAAMLVACTNAPEPSPTPPPTAVVQPSPTPTPVPLIPVEVIDNATKSLVEAGSIWFVLEHENGFTEALGGLELTRVEGAITETGMSIAAEANLGRIYIEVEAILIGTDTWLTNPLTGEWELLPDEQNPIGFLQPIAAVRGVLEGLTEAEYITNPQPGVDYQITSPLRADALKSLLGETIPDGIGLAEVVIDHESFEMKSARITGSLQVRDSDSTVRILQMSRYGEDFVIEQPIP